MKQTKFSLLCGKITAMVSALILLCSFGGIGVNAATEIGNVEVGDFTVKCKTSDYGNSFTITQYNGSGGEVSYPASVTFNGVSYPITETAAVLKNNVKVTSVIIPEGYQTVSTSAFEGCTKLESVTIPGSVTSMMAGAFKNCSALKTVAFSEDTAETLALNNDVLFGCTALETLELPARFSSASNNFVRGCTSLKSLTIREGAQNFTAEDNILYQVTETSAKLVAYAYGKENTTLSVPAAVAGKPVTAIGPHAFRENAVLTQITVPDSVTDIGYFAFDGMAAIQTVTLKTTTPPTLGSSAFTNMAAGSKIVVENEAVAAALEPSDSYTSYYTADNTTVELAGNAANVSAAFSIAAESELTDGKVSYSVYLDRASNVNTVLLKLAFDSAQVSEGILAVGNDRFSSSSSRWNEEEGKLILTAYLGTVENVTGYSSEEKTKIATITVPLQEGAKGSITAELIKAACGGVYDVEESAMAGETTIVEPASVGFFLVNYDVNGDGTVDIVDITEAQRYYQAVETDDTWTVARAMDVNGDKKVDVADYIEIFQNLSDF